MTYLADLSLTVNTANIRKTDQIQRNITTGNGERSFLQLKASSDACSHTATILKYICFIEQQTTGNDAENFEEEKTRWCPSASKRKQRENMWENQTTGLSYRRPTRDYTRSTKWTYEMNKKLYQLYKDSKPGKRGYMNRLKELWDKKYEIYNNFTAKHLAEQVRNIKKKKLLPNLDMETNELVRVIDIA